MIQADAGESGSVQSRNEGSRLDGYKRAICVDHAVEPSIRDFKSKEAAARLQDAVNFREGAILERARTQMMQHEDGDGRGEGAVGEGQCCRVALHDAGAFTDLLRKPCGECMVVFETGYARNAPSQFGCGGARPRANFEKVIAQVRSAQHKRQELIARYPAPQRCRAEPIFEGVQFSAPFAAYRRDWDALKRAPTTLVARFQRNEEKPKAQGSSFGETGRRSFPHLLGIKQRPYRNSRIQRLTRAIMVSG